MRRHRITRTLVATASALSPGTALDLGSADGIFVAGGLTPGYHAAIMPAADTIRGLVASGVPYAGFSAGAMIAAAEALAAGFDFVRVDLYDGSDGIYFGELTFTPAASLGIAPAAAGDHAENATHRVYSGIVMAALAGDGRG